VLPSVVDKVAMDLVRYDDDVVRQATLGHGQQFLPLEHAPHRVMRVAEKEEARRRGDGGTHAVHVRHVAPVGAASEGHLLPLEAGVPGRGEERPVDGRLHQGAVSRLAKGMAGHVQAGHHAGDEDQILRLDAPAIQARQPLDEDRAQFARLARVAEYAMLDALPQGLNHRLRRAKVHVRHPHRQNIAAAVFGPFQTV